MRRKVTVGSLCQGNAVWGEGVIGWLRLGRDERLTSVKKE